MVVAINAAANPARFELALPCHASQAVDRSTQRHIFSSREEN
jgi:hypothetical protein